MKIEKLEIIPFGVPIRKFSDAYTGFSVSNAVIVKIYTNKGHVGFGEACVNESGDILKVFKDPLIPIDNFIGEIGEYFLNKIDGRYSSDEITLFKSIGTAIQDFEVANRIYNMSITEKFGEEIYIYE